MTNRARELITEAEMWAPTIVKFCALFGEDPERGLRMSYPTLATLAGCDVHVIKRTVLTPLFRKLFQERMAEIVDNEKPTVNALYRELTTTALLGAFRLRAILEDPTADQRLVAKVAIDVIDRAAGPMHGRSGAPPIAETVNVLTVNLLNTPEKRARAQQFAQDLILGATIDAETTDATSIPAVGDLVQEETP